MRLPPLRRSLSARLLLLTVVFVMAASTLFLLPLLASYRQNIIGTRLMAAHLAILGLDDSAPGASPAHKAEILRHIYAHSIVMTQDGAPSRTLSEASPPVPAATYDLESASAFRLVSDAVESIGQRDNRVIRLHGRSPRDPSVMLDVVTDERPILTRTRRYAAQLLMFAALISVIASGLVYLSLRTLVLMPLRHLTAGMISFRNHPEDPGRVIAVSGRRDEIGLAEWELAAMQSALRRTLGQRGRLAALGEAVSKINHDLRSILSTARLVSDRLTESADPIVKKSLPPLLSSLDRAVRLCKRTLDFAAAQPVLRRSQFELRRFVEDAVATAALVETGGFTFINEIASDARLHADRDQFFRAIVNLVRNAVQAKARRLSMKTRLADDGGLVLTIMDDGAGIPKPAQATLFRPFAASGTSGGTGLGLAIARDVVRSHGGNIELASTGPMGTTFEITLPVSAIAATAEARAQRRWGAFRSVDGRKQG